MLNVKIFLRYETRTVAANGELSVFCPEHSQPALERFLQSLKDLGFRVEVEPKIYP